jgi:hypothetical protein
VPHASALRCWGRAPVLLTRTYCKSARWCVGPWMDVLFGFFSVRMRVCGALT